MSRDLFIELFKVDLRVWSLNDHKALGQTAPIQVQRQGLLCGKANPYTIVPAPLGIEPKVLNQIMTTLGPIPFFTLMLSSCSTE